MTDGPSQWISPVPAASHCLYLVEVRLAKHLAQSADDLNGTGDPMDFLMACPISTPTPINFSDPVNSRSEGLNRQERNNDDVLRRSLLNGQRNCTAESIITSSFIPSLGCGRGGKGITIWERTFPLGGYSN